MVKTLHKQTCPTCGQSVNEREILLYKGMVDALARVFKWCSEKRKWDDLRFKDFNHLLGPNEIARFSDWPSFDKMIENDHRKYTFHEKEIAEFLANKRRIPTRILRDPLHQPRDTFFDPKFAREVSPLFEFMDNEEYVVAYGGTSEVAVESHISSSSRPLLYHSLRRKPDGTFWCTCEGYKFRGRCKHIEEQQAARLF